MRNARRLVGLPLVIAVTAGLMLFPSRTAQATSPGRDGRIAFADLITGQIYAINPDGTGLVQLTHVGDGQFAGNPSWSPNGKHVAFDSNMSGEDRLWIMDADASHMHMVSNDRRSAQDSGPAYTPDGGRLVYTRCLREPCAIYSIRTDGTRRRALTPFHEGLDLDPAVSPDGRIAFWRFFANGIISQVFVMGAGGSGAHAITPPALEGALPDWSPDGKRVTFTSNWCCRLPEHVYEVNPNGSGIHRLTSTPFPNQDFTSAYSPGGDQIAFASDRRYPVFTASDLFVMRASGAHETFVRTGLPYVLSPAWGSSPPIPPGSAPAPAIRTVSPAEIRARRAAWCRASPVPLKPLCGGSG